MIAPKVVREEMDAKPVITLRRSWLFSCTCPVGRYNSPGGICGASDNGRGTWK